jgi:hypothetical protein
MGKIVNFYESFAVYLHYYSNKFSYDHNDTVYNNLTGVIKLTIPINLLDI